VSAVIKRDWPHIDEVNAGDKPSGREWEEQGETPVLETALRVLPATLAGPVARLPQAVRETLEEIRIRQDRPLEVVYGGRYGFLAADGKLSVSPFSAYRPTRGDCRQLIDLISNHSLYAMEEQLRRGFITVAGGHRVGIAGRVVLERGTVRHMRDIAGFNMRIAREVRGVADRILPLIWDEDLSSVRHTLVVSPPGAGKTTLVRDMARALSYGRDEGPFQRPALKVGIVDERSELAACVEGVPSFDVGPRTDVYDGVPKAEGMMMMIRAMSPDVIVVDEIGREEDAASIHEAVLSGIRVVATAHGRDWRDVAGKPVLKELIAAGAFSRIVVLERSRRVSGGITVLDGSGRPLVGRPAPAAAGRSP